MEEKSKNSKGIGLYVLIILIVIVVGVIVYLTYQLCLSNQRIDVLNAKLDDLNSKITNTTVDSKVQLKNIDSMKLSDFLEDTTEKIIGDYNYMEVAIDNSTGEISYTDFIRVADIDSAKRLVNYLNDSKKLADEILNVDNSNYLIDYESCPLINIYLKDGTQLHITGAEFGGFYENKVVFSVWKSEDGQDKTTYVCNSNLSDFTFTTFVNNLYNASK